MHFLIGFLENRGSLLTVCLGLGSGLLKGTVRVVLSVSMQRCQCPIHNATLETFI